MEWETGTGANGLLSSLHPQTGIFHSVCNCLSEDSVVFAGGRIRSTNIRRNGCGGVITRTAQCRQEAGLALNAGRIRSVCGRLAERGYRQRPRTSHSGDGEQGRNPGETVFVKLVSLVSRRGPKKQSYRASWGSGIPGKGDPTTERETGIEENGIGKSGFL